jgi:hypothetical protein
MSNKVSIWCESCESFEFQFPTSYSLFQESNSLHPTIHPGNRFLMADSMIDSNVIYLFLSYPTKMMAPLNPSLWNFIPISKYTAPTRVTRSIVINDVKFGSMHHTSSLARDISLKISLQQPLDRITDGPWWATPVGSFSFHYSLGWVGLTMDPCRW